MQSHKTFHTVFLTSPFWTRVTINSDKAKHKEMCPRGCSYSFFFLVSGWRVSVSKTTQFKGESLKASEKWKGGIMSERRSKQPRKLNFNSSNLVGVNHERRRRREKCGGVSPRALLKAGRSLWKNNSNMNSFLIPSKKRISYSYPWFGLLHLKYIKFKLHSKWKSVSLSKLQK